MKEVSEAGVLTGLVKIRGWVGTEDREDYFAHPGRQQPVVCPHTPNSHEPQPGLTFTHQAGKIEQTCHAAEAERD